MNYFGVIRKFLIGEKNLEIAKKVVNPENIKKVAIDLGTVVPIYGYYQKTMKWIKILKWTAVTGIILGSGLFVYGKLKPNVIIIERKIEK